MKKNTLLWSIRLPFSDHQHYLFGTMHTPDSRNEQLIAKLKPYIQSCQVFASEIDFSEFENFQQPIHIALPPDTNLKKLLSRSAWKNWEWIAQHILHLPSDAILKIHPADAHVFITASIIKGGSHPILDQSLFEIAQNLEKKCTGLERLQEQIDISQSISLEMHLRHLTWMLKNFGKYQRLMKRTTDLYFAQEIHQLHQLARKFSRGLRKTLTGNRDKIMTNRFLEIAKTDALFAAVGAAHLSGGKGMLRLLKKEGCRVKPVFF